MIANEVRRIEEYEVQISETCMEVQMTDTPQYSGAKFNHIQSGTTVCYMVLKMTKRVIYSEETREVCAF